MIKRMFFKVAMVSAVFGLGLSQAGENCDNPKKAEGDKVQKMEIKDQAKKGDLKRFGAISQEDLVKLIEAKQVLLVDANGSDSYQKGHIPGAVSFQDKEAFKAALPEDKDAAIVAYCGGPKCEAWGKAAGKLEKKGYTNVRYYKGGMKEWKDAGLEVATPEIAKKEAKQG